MLYVFYGTDAVNVRKAAHSFLAEEYEQKGYTIDRIAPEAYEAGMLVDRAGAQSLFSDERTVTVLDTPSEQREVFEDVLEHVEILGESPNSFVLVETGLRAPEKKAFAKHAHKMHEEKADQKKDFNIFSMTDALLRRDKKSLWVLLVRARERGISGEEVVGVLYWQVKMLMLAERTNSPEEAGQKPFVYTKTKKGLSALKAGEPTALSRSLLTFYHEAHLGKQDIDIALERFMLSL